MGADVARPGRRKALALLLAGCAGMVARGAFAHEGHTVAPKADSAPAPARVKLVDVELVDQQRRRGRLARDIVGGRVVMANFVFTTCSSVCPVISAVFAQAQRQLPATLRADTRLLSLTVDPMGDTPERMAAMAARYGSEDIWRWVTGRVENVEAALKGFGAYSARPDDHIPMAVVGDPARDIWYRFMGTPEPGQLARTVQSLHAQREKGKAS